MCCDDSSGVPLSFSQLVGLLQQPPFEPCESELEFLTLAEYNALFAETWNRYFRPIRFYIAHIMEDREVAADLAQKVFISLYTARASFERPYIYRAAKNAAFDELRRRNREIRALRRYWRGLNLYRSSPEELDAPDPQPLQDTMLIERRREAALSLAVERLPEIFECLSCCSLRAKATGKS